jgi:hypothetical protein
MTATTLGGRPEAGQPATESAQSRLGELLESWRYGESGRDLRLDLLRGFAVFAMVVDHIGIGGSTWLYRLTGGGRFFTTAAEGFVFISGLVFGIVYALVLAREGLVAAMLKALRRAGLLYLLTVALTLTTAAVAVRFDLYWAPDPTRETLRDFVLGVVTLQRTFFLVDVLLLYTLLLLAAAISLVFFSSGRTWLVLAASWGLWALWQIDHRYASVAWAIQDNTLFHFSPWQVLFFTGLAIGYHRRALAGRFGWLTSPWALLVSGGLFAWLIVLYRNGLAGFPGADSLRVVASFTDKPNVGPSRIFAFAVVAIFAISLATTLWRPLAAATGWLLLPLGQHALFAYALHLFLLGALWRLSVYTFGYGPTEAEYVFLQLLGAGAMLWAVRLKVRLLDWGRRLSQVSLQRLVPARAR